MGRPLLAGTVDQLPPRKGGTGKPALWTEEDLQAFVAMLHESPVLLSIAHYRSRSTCDHHARRLRDLLEPHGVHTRTRVWRESEGPNIGRYRWAVIRQEEESNHAA
jgi:hypothetical protein